MASSLTLANKLPYVAPHVAPYVAVSGLGKHFDDRQVLKGLDLQVPVGEFLAVIGKSGCGKSTLLRLLAGLTSPDEGSIRVGGNFVKGPSAETRLMFQDARLLPWKRVLPNVALGLKGENRDKKALQALTQVGLLDRARDWPTVLSGGQRQRIALARALAHTPRLLLLDEPLGALDALTRIEMQELIENLWLERRFTAVLITHEVEEALVLADRVIVLDEGRIVLEVVVDLPRPRQRSTPGFISLKSRILDRILGNQKSFREDEKISQHTSRLEGPLEPKLESQSELQWATLA
jgi:sulfonate transport system ATP-binding protein